MDIFEFFNTATASPAASPPPPDPPSCVPHVESHQECDRFTPTSILGHFQGLHGRRKSSVTSEPKQQPPTTFMDFVRISDRKPLTELTRREAWWPVVFGE
jgi:hypothetical protein